MTTIQERLTDAAERTHRSVERVDVDAGLAAAARERRDPIHRRRGPLLAVAAVALATIVVGVAVSLGTDDGGQSVVADAPSTTSEPAHSTIPGFVIPAEQIELFVDADLDGSIWYAGVERAFHDQWSAVAGDGAPPEVDFDTEVVVGFTIGTDQGCDVSVSGARLMGSFVEPQFAPVAAADCEGAISETVTFVLRIARDDLPQVFTFDLSLADQGFATDASLEIDLSTADASVSPTTSVVPPPVEGPDLQEAAPGRLITVDGAGDVRLGGALDPATVQSHEGTSCGYWGPQEPSHDGDEPLSGLAGAADTSAPRVVDVRVSENLTYRTASGVGIGTTLASLQRIHGDDLVVDRADGWDRPTGGLLAMYQDVAAVRNGDHALTFRLRGDVVEGIKVSEAEWWGDDEGCA